MKIYGFPTFNVTKVLLTAEWLGLEYEYIPLDPSSGEIKTPEHMARHPLGKVPALEHEGSCFFESAAICRYLARISHSDLYSGDAKQKAVIDQWVDMVSQHIGRWLSTFFFQEIIMKKFRHQDTDAAAIKEAQGFLDSQLPAMENQFKKNRYLCGDQFTIADAIAAAYIQITEITSFNMEGYPNIIRWYNDIKNTPAFERAMANYPGNMIYH